MKVNVQLYTLAALAPGEEPPVHTGHRKLGRPPEPVWTPWKLCRHCHEVRQDSSHPSSFNTRNIQNVLYQTLKCTYFASQALMKCTYRLATTRTAGNFATTSSRETHEVLTALIVQVAPCTWQIVVTTRNNPLPSIKDMVPSNIRTTTCRLQLQRTACVFGRTA